METTAACQLLLVMFMPAVLSLQIDLCDHNRNAQAVKQEIISGEQSVVKKVSGLRSRVECVSYCLNEADCKTSTYQSQSGHCKLLGDYYADLSSTSSNDAASSVIILENYRRADSGCPSSGCTGNQSCLLDCSDREGFHSNSLARCTDTDPSQYRVNDQKSGCNMYPTFQFKEYYLPAYNHNAHSATFWTLTFSKIFSWTALRITINGSLRGGYSGWNWWRVYINDSLWSNPFRTEQIHYNSESDVDHHKSTSIAGLAYDIPVGNSRIQLRSEVSSSTTQAHFGGYTDGSRVYVEELGQRGLINGEQPPYYPCPQLPSFNAQEYGSSGSWSHDYDATLMSYGYLKLEDVSTLKINADFVARIYTGVTYNASVCAAWHIWVDGVDCSPQPIGRIVSNLNNAEIVYNEYRSVHMEGYCTGISKGLRNIQLRVRRCEWSINGVPVADASTGFNGNHNRIMVEEIHEGTDTAAITGPDGFIYQIPEFNFRHWAWGALNAGTDSGDVLSVTYAKKYDTSGLRLSLSAVQRSNGAANSAGSYDFCCRHHFIINGGACTNPGEIEGITRLNKITRLHRPIMIDGICEGVESGSVSIILRTAKCRGASLYGECYFGWNSYTSMKASETFVEREVATYSGNTRTN